MDTTPPTSGQDGPVSGPPWLETDLPAPAADGPETPVSVADLLRREGYDPEPELEWHSDDEPGAEPDDEQPVDAVPVRSRRWRRGLVAAGGAVGAGVIAATVLLVGTTSGQTQPEDPTPRAVSPYLELLVPSSPTPTPPPPEADEPAEAAKAPAIAPVVVQVSVVPGRPPATPTAAPAAGAAQSDDDDDSDDDAGGSGEEKSSDSPRSSSADSDSDDGGGAGDGQDAADSDQGDSDDDERPSSGGLLGGLLGGIGSVLGGSQ